MTSDSADVVEELRGMDAGDRVWVDFEGNGMWMRAKQAADYARPKRDQGGDWIGGRMTVEF